MTYNIHYINSFSSFFILKLNQFILWTGGEAQDEEDILYCTVRTLHNFVKY